MRHGEVTFAAKVPNWLGDSILAIPAVRAIGECSRRGKLVILASEISSEIMRRIPNTLVFPLRRPGGGLVNSIGSAIRGSRVLRLLRPVIVISFTRSVTSGLMCFLGRVPRRVGFKRSSLSFLYTDLVGETREREHLVRTYSRLPESIGIKVSDLSPSLQPLDDDLIKATNLLKRLRISSGKYFCIFPGATYGPAKRWPPSRFALLADMLVDRFNATPVVLGGKGDKVACTEVMSHMKRSGLDLCGQLDIGTLIGIVKFARGAIANDSGGMHLSAAVGTPVVGLFFSSDPHWTGPISPRSRYIYKKFECSPCFSRNCKRGNICTETISVEEVYESMSELAQLG